MPAAEKQPEINGRHSLRTSAMVCATIQIIATLGISLVLLIFVNNGRTSMIVVLIAINLLACAVAVIFLLLCVTQRKYGRKYDLILHGYLLSMLAEGLADLFACLYYPLSMLQNLNNWQTESIVQAAVMTGIGIIMLCYQLFQRHVVEEMLTYMEYNFK
uniref:MARVEL domain-containing protein n=1 Tax=Syphacia muris TaxID=451379 RepID=A0A0N5B104_9BILA